MMNTYELCCAIRRRIVAGAGETYCYPSWDETFALKGIKDIPANITADPDFKPIQPSELTKAQMDDLGFGRWDGESHIMLIPLWLTPFLAEEITCSCIDGDAGTFKRSEMDLDSRFGCIAYGVIPCDETTKSVEPSELLDRYREALEDIATSVHFRDSQLAKKALGVIYG